MKIVNRKLFNVSETILISLRALDFQQCTGLQLEFKWVEKFDQLKKNSDANVWLPYSLLSDSILTKTHPKGPSQGQ